MSIQIFKKSSKKNNKIKSLDISDVEVQHLESHTDKVRQVPNAVDSANIKTDSNVVGEGVGFAALGLSNALVQVCKSLGMTQPTQVQRECIPAVLKGKNAVGVAETGSGKTAAFALPMLQNLSRNPYGVYALVLTPTRELALQLHDQFTALGSSQTLKQCLVIGGLPMQPQATALTGRPHVVCATPGRLAAHMAADSDLSAPFSRLAVLVLDEADRVLEPSFGDNLRTILSMLPRKRQTLLFSATLTESVMQLQENAAGSTHVFQAYQGARAGSTITHELLIVPQRVKEVYLIYVLQGMPERGTESCIVFVGKRSTCRTLHALCQELSINSITLHSGLLQSQRLHALASFKAKQAPILIATDVASRGLDIPSVHEVINYDIPIVPEDYVHRIGRTGRAGRSGCSLSLACQFDEKHVQAIETMLGYQLSQKDIDENSVLDIITKVFNAKKKSRLKLLGEDIKQKQSKYGYSKFDDKGTRRQKQHT